MKHSRILTTSAALFAIALLSPNWSVAQSANGAVSGGWLMVEDFEGTSDVAAVNKLGGTPNGTVTVQARPDDETNHAACMENASGYNTVMGLTVTLPEGKTLKMYKRIAFDLYRFADDDNYKKMLVSAGADDIQYTDYIQQAPVTTWTEKSYSIGDVTSGNNFTLLLGIESGKGHYMIDNIRLEEKTAEELAAEAEPVTPDPSTNGMVTNGWLMLEDFQGSASVYAANINGGSAQGTVTVEGRPGNRENLGAHMSDADGYNTVIGVDVVLPSGKELKDYKTLKFDLYRFANDGNYKQMIVKAGDDVIYSDENYVQQAPSATWTEKSYEISEDIIAGNSFSLYLGIKTDAGNYMIDNIQLEEREQPADPGQPSQGESVVNPGLATSDGAKYVDGWLMLADFEDIPEGTAYDFCDRDGANQNTKGNAVVESVTDNDSQSTNALKATWTGNYDEVAPELRFTLPQKISEYKSISIALLRQTSSDYKPLTIYINGVAVVQSENNGCPTKADIWNVKTYSLEGKDFGDTDEVLISIYSKVTTGWVMYIDNIRLEPKYEIPEGPAENTAITLTDDNDYSFTETYTVPSATYSRSLGHNGWHAICLPFAVSDWSTFATRVIELADVTDDGKEVALEFATVAPGALTPGTPYIFIPGGDGIAISEENAEISPDTHPVTAGRYTFTGNYGTVAMEGNYALKDGAFYKGSSTARLKPFRAYITVTNPSSAPGRLKVKVDGEEVSGIEAVLEETTADGAVYNIQGVRIDPATPGLQIRQGRKTFVK